MRFTSGQICKIFCITKQRLLFYDKIGVLSPSYIDEKNKYRYYTTEQFPLIYMIISLSETGISLDNIKTYVENRTPEKAIDLLENHIIEIENKINRLKSIHDGLTGQLNRLKENQIIDIKEEFTIEYMPTQYLLSIPIEKINSYDDYDTNRSITVDYILNKSYRTDLGIGFIVDCIEPNMYNEKHLFIILDKKVQDEYFETKSSGKYLNTYHYGPYDSIESTYSKMIKFAKDNNLSISNRIYCVKIIDSLTAEDENSYVTKVMAEII